jgi:hypothetical protein
MISTLLWQCPVCKTQDAVEHEKRRRGPDKVTCTSCSMQWDLIRDFGGPDYLMRVVSGDNKNMEAPVAQWYDQMMEGLALVPIEHPDWPILGVSEPGESLYLFSRARGAFTFPNDPIFQDEKFSPVKVDTLQNGMELVGPGQIYFTSDRLLYLVAGGPIISLPWANLGAADTLIDIIFTIRSGERFFFFKLEGQSVLKWLAYARLIVKQLDGGQNQKIHLGCI